jgi:DHA1 family bicyclomycin/chloramphenicol resistance-like MFS transporter
VQFGVGALAAPLVGLLGVGAVAMALVVAGGMVAANAVLMLVVRPWRLPLEAAEPVPAAAH